MTAAEIREVDSRWERTVYRGDRVRELSLSSLGIGAFVGGVLILGNVYMGLRAGVVAGGSLVAALVSFLVVRALRRSFTDLENNIAQTVGSASGTVGGACDVLPALVLLGTPLTWPQALVWCLSVSVLGVLFAVPLRRQIVVVEQLPFPDGVACAETIRSLHRHDGAARRKAGVLGASAAIAAAFALVRDGLPTLLTGAFRAASAAAQERAAALAQAVQVPDRVFPFDTLGRVFRGHTSSEVYLGFTTSPMFLAIGVLVGPRIGLSMLLGALVSWGLVAPWLLDVGVVQAIKYRETVQWTMWVGTALMVSAGMTTLLKHGGLLLGAFRSLGRMGGGGAPGRGLELSPRAWAAGLAAASGVVLLVLKIEFDVPVWAGALAIALSFLLAIMATRACGETNNNPVGAMGHVTQGMFSGVGGGGPFANVLAGGITAAGASQAADLMQDLKTGYLLGATPRRQVAAQMVGAVVGALVAVPAFFLLWRAYGLGPDSEMLPAPSGVSWSGFARVLSEGFDAMPPHAGAAMAIAAALGVLLSLPPRGMQRWLPSPFGIGIAFIYPGMYALTICLGAILAAVVGRVAPGLAERHGVLVASGLIAGEAVTGTLVAAWSLGGAAMPLALFVGLPVAFLIALGGVTVAALGSFRRSET